MVVLYSDAHLHSNPVSGLGAERIGEKMKETGAWFACLVSLPPYHYGFGLSVDDYRRSIDILVSEAEKLRKAGLKVRVLAGFHPAEIDEHIRHGRSPEEILDLAEKVFKIIVEKFKEGVLDGIGEVGRQHYSTAPHRVVLSELIMIRAFEIARDHDMIVHLHLEQGGYTTVKSIERLIDFIRLREDAVFLHHVTYNEAVHAEKTNMNYTVPAKYRSLKKVFSLNLSRLLIESDFIDDPRRPGVSSYPWDIPKRMTRLIEEGIIDEEQVNKIFIDNTVKAYQVEPP